MIYLAAASEIERDGQRQAATMERRTKEMNGTGLEREKEEEKDARRRTETEHRMRRWKRRRALDTLWLR